MEKAIVSSMRGSRLKECIPNLKDCFRIDSLILNGAEIVFCRGGDKPDKHFMMSDKDSLNEENFVLFRVFNEHEHASLLEKSGLPFISFYTLLIVEHIYIGKLNTPVIDMDELNDREASFVLDVIEENDYIDYIRPDMLQLYKFVNDWKKIPQEEPVTLLCGSKKLQLKNKQNWIFKAINDYLAKHIKVNSIEDVENKLVTRYTKKTGRKTNNPYQTLMIYGIDKLYQKSTNSEEITNQQCEFIRDYLKYIELPITNDGFDDNDDIKNIRSRIRYLRKNGCSEKWGDTIDDFLKRPIYPGY